MRVRSDFSQARQLSTVARNPHYEQLEFDLTLKNLLTISEPHFSNGYEKTTCPVGLLGRLKVRTECLGQGLTSCVGGSCFDVCAENKLFHQNQ